MPEVFKPLQTAMYLRPSLSNVWNLFQGELFPEFVEEVGPLLEKHKRLVQVLGRVEVERFVEDILDNFHPEECAAFFKNAGYAST